MIRLGIIGCGAMAATHAKNFTAIKGVALAACCDVNRERAGRFAAEWRIPKSFDDYRQMFASEKLDAVSIVTADDSHAPLSLAALREGLAVMCEKPLATTLADAVHMRDAARQAGAVTHVNFSYRNAACVQAAAGLIRGGGIGRVLHVEASYLQSWLVQDTWGDWRTTEAFTWRLSRRHGSGGVLGDVGCHIYDLAAFLCGPLSEISCRLGTFDKGVPENRVGPYVLDANDSFVSSVTFADGGLGTVHATRWATGQVNSLKVRVYGDRGAVDIDLDRSVESFLVARMGASRRAPSWKEVRAPRVPSQYERFAAAVKKGHSDESDFANGARVQAYLEASFTSDRRRRPEKVRL
ncbi:MAG TPA: Gfo/Idh/MocA family oxidoreductase [Spirochaetia bacterium]|nr:Gfo/Idh/MocA family oxidoreductase [Spirochaetia bacterium]